MSVIINFIKRIFIYPVKYSANEHFKMVLVVRSDIVMGKGKIAAQCAHAAVECYRQASCNTKYEHVFNSWLLQGQPKVVLKICNEGELMSLARSARKAGLIISIIQDAGKTQLLPGTVSTLGIGPGPKQAIDELTSSLKLL
ncbi:peptidyl-tRNA hydrolase 2, mitochondrial [Megachile rotundata]|uniref:peptidyl-tRNA hydrolase 2, mitochondrial n=1 Tax=Megachile rotundata TaxID=143995 RepID=UPI000614B5C9|nr:PREDICTED: peptidyl-tRNA hydrolase 2, mitochondrial-like isoform X2 [Megachile rotundata]XP_012151754.1 PREDICTED: peptidyl-tRNA hydrolase 2, mitochondrial-like isoform X1 [Megachile rotundata]XP_012151755.1 PREDICTED: peptidyl-tRNA hydrolase 2, mitochondrial-like isoform X1 [Megachile rotundata]